MKRLVSLILVLALCLSICFALVGCADTKHGECGLCGKEADLTDITADGETGYFCDDCYETAEYIAELAEALG